jgi:hypothetical protein
MSTMIRVIAVAKASMMTSDTRHAASQHVHLLQLQEVLGHARVPGSGRPDAVRSQCAFKKLHADVNTLPLCGTDMCGQKLPVFDEAGPDDADV